MSMELSQSEENYIKAIYAIQLNQTEAVATNDLAEKMETKASSVTDMLKRLAEKEYITYVKYQGCELTESGLQIALKTIRKHRLWETFLVEKLQFGWDEVHEIAEQLEHIQSPELTNRLDEFLAFPKFDPHGDPIPDASGNLAMREKSLNLNELALNTPAIVIGVSDGSPSFLRYLDSHQINLGATIEVLELFEFDDSRRVKINGAVFNLSAAACSKLTVQLKTV